MSIHFSPPLPAEMILAANSVGFGEPRSKLVVDLVGMREPKGVHVISRREGFDPPKPRRFEPTRQHDVTIEPSPAWRDLRERHAHLKGDPRLLGQDSHGPNAADGGHHAVEQHADFARLAGEVMTQVERPAGVRLPPVREYASALRAAPQRSFNHVDKTRGV